MRGASPTGRPGCWKMPAASSAFWCWKQRADGFLLDNIAVLPECQGKGHGRVLIEFAEAEARRRGFQEIHLYTHALMTENIALYRRIGFVETRRVSEKGYDRVYMTKRLQ